MIRIENNLYNQWLEFTSALKTACRQKIVLHCVVAVLTKTKHINVNVNKKKTYKEKLIR